MYFIDKTDFEVSGFGLVEHNKENNFFIVNDVFLLKQENTAAHTDIDGQDLAKLLYETRTMNGSLRFWWHSHVNMAAFWSSQDITTIKELGSQGWITAGVFNKKREYKAAVCWQSQSELGSTLQINDNIELVVGTPHLDAELVAQWDAEFAAKVTEKKFTAQAWHAQSYAHDYWREKETPKETPKDTKVEKAQDENQFLNDFRRMGLLGYGAVNEAQALKMSYEKYERLVSFGSDQDYDDILSELKLLEQAGFFGWDYANT